VSGRFSVGVSRLCSVVAGFVRSVLRKGSGAFIGYRLVGYSLSQCCCCCCCCCCCWKNRRTILSQRTDRKGNEEPNSRPEDSHDNTMNTILAAAAAAAGVDATNRFEQMRNTKGRSGTRAQNNRQQIEQHPTQHSEKDGARTHRTAPHQTAKNEPTTRRACRSISGWCSLLPPVSTHPSHRGMPIATGSSRKRTQILPRFVVPVVSSGACTLGRRSLYPRNLLPRGSRLADGRMVPPVSSRGEDQNVVSDG